MSGAAAETTADAVAGPTPASLERMAIGSTRGRPPPRGDQPRRLVAVPAVQLRERLHPLPLDHLSIRRQRIAPSADVVLRPQVGHRPRSHLGKAAEAAATTTGSLANCARLFGATAGFGSRLSSPK